MIELLAVGFGGFLGAVARYGLGGLFHRGEGGTFPFGTMVVNVAGCLSIGLLMGVIAQRPGIPPAVRLFLVVGLLGSFTTFSAVGFETFEFLRAGAFRPALLNAAGNLGLGLLAVFAGWGIARAVG